jgi:glucosylceramidase
VKNSILAHCCLLGIFFIFLSSCTQNSSNEKSNQGNATSGSAGPGAIEFWLTNGDQSILLKPQAVNLAFGTIANSNQTIDVDTTKSFQQIDGFGFALTGGSAAVINQLDPDSKAKILKELFGQDQNSIGISYLRLSIGSSDLNASVFSYDDMPKGQTDKGLQHFTLDPDRGDLIPILKQILLINPSIKIMATAWSAPAWMKSNNSTAGGSLQLRYFPVYANYYVKYIKGMQAEGIRIDAITPQNEPLNPDNNPSMVMTANDQLSFVKNNLGPAFQKAGITTKIVLYDHNCDKPDYPLTILKDKDVRPFVDGSAFHLYAGDVSAIGTVHNAYPDKKVYFTEQYTGSDSKFADEIKWHLKNVIIGTMRNWSCTALEWNLANNPEFGPHTPGGCTTCKGALTISPGNIVRNVGYYIIAHASKFVPPGSVRIASNITGDLQNVAFLTPRGKKVIIVENDGSGPSTFNIRFNNQWFSSGLAAGAVGTYSW